MRATCHSYFHLLDVITLITSAAKYNDEAHHNVFFFTFLLYSLFQVQMLPSVACSVLFPWGQSLIMSKQQAGLQLQFLYVFDSRRKVKRF
jgi:hypothetical protein